MTGQVLYGCLWIGKKREQWEIDDEAAVVRQEYGGLFHIAGSMP